jgi:hypothetical protein
VSVTTLTSQDPFRLTLTTPAEVVGGEIVLTAENLVGAGVTPAAVQSAQDTADQALADASVVWLPVHMADVTDDAATAVCPAPFAGTFTGLRGASNVAPDADLVFTATISGQALANNAITVASASPIGTVAARAVSGENTVTLSSCVVITLATTNAQAGNATILCGFTREST